MAELSLSFEGNICVQIEFTSLENDRCVMLKCYRFRVNWDMRQ